MEIQNVLPRDAIPSIDDATFGPEYFGEGDDEVIAVESDPPRAYPVRILSYHEIVNDVLVGASPGQNTPEREERPIAVTWCPICASAVVYDRRVDARVLTFGTSGKLADDALVMYDRETGSEWKQPLGEAIGGPLDGTELTVLPASMTTWTQFRSASPDGVVLQPVRGGADDPGAGSPRAAYDMSGYARYDASPAFGLRAMRGEGPERSWDRDDIGAKTMVLGVVHAGDAVGYPRPVVRDLGGVVIDSVGGLDILVVVSQMGIHAFENPGHGFEMREGRLYGDGVSWDPTTGESDDGRRLTRVPARRLYAFAWQDDHGAGSFYGLG
jgi:hypothetical protein